MVSSTHVASGNAQLEKLCAISFRAKQQYERGQKRHSVAERRPERKSLAELLANERAGRATI